MAQKNPVVYAEQDLGVHAIYDQAVAELVELEDTRNALTTLVGDLRGLRDAIADREAVVAVSERGSVPHDMSATAFEKHLKVALQQDTELVALRGDLRAKQREHDVADNRVAVLGKRLEVATSRMTELGGLLTFYAAVKMAAASRS